MEPTNLSVPVEYRLFHKYLSERFADTVVLRFDEIEDLLGFMLPTAAQVQPEWWSAGEPGGEPSAQARAWVVANRVATPNLMARTVSFERVSP
jgi:hypothetical protein